MQQKLSSDTIAIVASNLTAALVASGQHRVTDADPRGDVLAIYWDFCSELEGPVRREER